MLHGGLSCSMRKIREPEGSGKMLECHGCDRRVLEPEGYGRMLERGGWTAMDAIVLDARFFSDSLTVFYMQGSLAVLYISGLSYCVLDITWILFFTWTLLLCFMNPE